MAKKPPRINRPHPPQALIESYGGLFVPAQEVWDWVKACILDESGPLYNPDHQHLKDARVGILWTSEPNVRQGVPVVGMAEIPLFRAGRWQKARQEQQIIEWFGEIPEFLITLDAQYASEVPDSVFAALVEHELYHCAQALDEFGMPKYAKDGSPKLTMRGHDVEEFVGIVRRYGAGNAAGQTAQLVAAAQKSPEITPLQLTHACGTCLKLVA